MRRTALILLCAVLAVCEAHITIPLERQHRQPVSGSRKRVNDVSIINNHIQFVAPIYIGTPAQPFKVHIDTGSVLTAINKAGCTQCDQQSPDPHYNPGASSTSQMIACSSNACTASTCYTGNSDNACSFSVEYYKGQIAGELYSDVVSLGNYSVTTDVGVIIKSSTDWEQPGADGIMGLAYNNQELTCRPNCVTPLYDALRGVNSDLPDVFALYVTNTGGYLTLGGWEPALIQGPVLYTPVLDQSLYYVQLNSMSVGGHVVSSSATNPIVDSGTSIILLPSKMFTAFVQYVQSEYSNIPLVSGSSNIFNDLCYTRSSYNAAIKLWPTITFTFSDVQVTLPPTSYILELVTGTDDQYCLFILESSDNSVTLGIPLFVGNTIIFDRVNNQVGFGSSIGSGTNVTNAASTTGSSSSTSSTHSSFSLIQASVFITLISLLFLSL